MPNFTLADGVFEAAASQFATPFHLYDEAGLRQRARDLNAAFSWCHDFKEYFAVKALPNPAILRILKEEGCGVDCSRDTELMLAESADLVYNGRAQTHGGFTLAADTALVEGHTAAASQGTEITNVSEGEVENRLTLLVRDSEGGDQTANYVFEQTEAGTIRILPRPITVTADDTQKTYDGTPLTGESVSVDNLAEGQTLTAALLGSRTTVGTAVVTVDEASVSIVSGETAVDMANYTLSFAAGTLTVTKRPVTILSADDTRVYDGTALSNGTVTALDLVEGHTAQVESLTEIVNVWDGPIPNVLTVAILNGNDEDMTRNYAIT